jgi:hypothetical protein
LVDSAAGGGGGKSTSSDEYAAGPTAAGDARRLVPDQNLNTDCPDGDLAMGGRVTQTQQRSISLNDPNTRGQVRPPPTSAPPGTPSRNRPLSRPAAAPARGERKQNLRLLLRKSVCTSLLDGCAGRLTAKLGGCRQLCARGPGAPDRPVAGGARADAWASEVELHPMRQRAT